MTSRLLWLSVLSASLSSLSARTLANVVSDFNSDLDGWTVVGSGALSYSSGGGNPGGFARFDDTFGAGGDGFLVAPVKFLGEWFTLDDGGTLEWDHRILNLGDGPTSVVNARALITGPGGAATFAGPVHQTTWTSFSAPISSSVWEVTSGSWSALLANVTSLQIRVEAVHNNGTGPNLDIDGIDNVRLSCPTPGDANGDGCVSGADYTLWADNFGTGTTFAQGDFNGDRQVTGADYTIWADNFGVGCQPSPVPEPQAFTLAALLPAAWFVRRRGNAKSDQNYLLESADRPLTCTRCSGR